ncbi:MAG: anthranilate phosphoribosyltransferase [Bosea sp. (in: a-proteobacteria)]|uniref:anthranilate phosphoribosyltransferase n=1 Tax=Bosea sp. (in: a-proteobacteria) TaxID=1871050 RepID=UPI0027367A46|nr:anthranilate phosphoribosyltransferase [Bosea sp. (in: a-proteobacteria)]MDP3603213.1 anthranilate phosphoribosyltransferase [Bosea sp. (in: a-proteobacteria)]
MDDFKPFIAKVATGASLSRDEARDAFDTILSGGVTNAQAAAFLMALRVRGETTEEITGAVGAMRGKMLTVEAPADAIDIVGTGGDSSGSYNVSTLASIITAACGVPVAKHGNRAASSKTGTADVLMALGVKVGLDPAATERCIAQAGVGFMFAPTHHASMRHVAPVRVELGTRTIFNLLGPLSNPAGVKKQLIGAFSETWLEPMVKVLASLGSTRVWAVHGSDGLDEITTTGPTRVVSLDNGTIESFQISPEDVGLARARPEDLRGGEPAQNADALRAVLDGQKTAFRDIAALNAAAGLLVAGRAGDLRDGFAQANAALDSGKAKATLAALVASSNA